MLTYSTVIFYVVFGHPMTNFGSLSRREAHSLNVNHCVSIILCLRGHWQPHSKVFKNLGWIAKRPTEWLSHGKLMNTKKVEIYQKTILPAVNVAGIASFSNRVPFGKFRCYLNMLLKISQIFTDWIMRSFWGIWSKSPIC